MHLNFYLSTIGIFLFISYQSRDYINFTKISYYERILIGDRHILHQMHNTASVGYKQIKIDKDFFMNTRTIKICMHVIIHHTNSKKYSTNYAIAFIYIM